MDKIVIIEDDPCIRTVLRLALKGAGYSALYEADRGDDGLALVLHEQPALVLLDLMLPGLDGLSVCREIRRSETVSTTPIIMLTAKSAESDIVAGLELGADDYVTKPFSKAILLARIKAALRRPGPLQDSIRTLGDLPARHGAVPVHRAGAHNAIRLRDASCPAPTNARGASGRGGPSRRSCSRGSRSRPSGSQTCRRRWRPRRC